MQGLLNLSVTSLELQRKFDILFWNLNVTFILHFDGIYAMFTRGHNTKL